MPLHDDDPAKVLYGARNQPARNADGRVIRNYTDEEYEATYAEGDPCNAGIPADVLEAAERSASRVARFSDAPERAGPVILPWHPSPYFTPGRRDDQAIIAHSVESGITPGIAVSLADGWFRNQAGTSAHKIFDPTTRAQMVLLKDTAWHVGGGNSRTIGYEHAGRAAMTRAQWTVPAGLAMLRESARSAADDGRERSIPARWLSVTQLANGVRGHATHNDCRLAFGGTTHTDPGPGFPYDIYMQMVREFTDGTEDMPLSTEDKNWIKEAIKAALSTDGVSDRKYIIDTVNGAVTAALANSNANTENVLFWVIYQLATGKLDAHSRYARDRFISDPRLAALLQECVGNGQTDLAVSLNILHGKVNDVREGVHTMLGDVPASTSDGG